MNNSRSKSSLRRSRLGGLTRPQFYLVLIGLLSLGVALSLILHGPGPEASTTETDSPRADPGAWLEAREREAARTVWAKEILAQECGRVIESFWDSLNAATNKLSLAARFPAGEILLGKWGSPESLPHAIQLQESAGPGPALSTEAWRRQVEELNGAGWRLEQTEFRHTRFETDETGQPKQSRFYFSAHLTNPTRSERAILEGDLMIDWTPDRSPGKPPLVKRIDASQLTIKTRAADAAFQPVLLEEYGPAGKSQFIDPLIVYDLDGDGLSEIILAARNEVYRPAGEDRYQRQPLCQQARGTILHALIADFDGDGAADLLCAKPEGLDLFSGSQGGAFEQPGRLAWSPSQPLQNPMALTCGDIDSDGDLDLFLGQYRVPSLGQVLRPDYYDANDGFPAYLLLNDGKGTFRDVTAAAGLESKRHRRTFSASFANLDQDPHLDLVVISDFAGVDLYRNKGRGRFEDVTEEWIADPRAFGMAHVLTDFNVDGQLDLLMIGMNSPTVDRLEHLGLWRPGAGDRTMAPRMTHGNRLYLARPEGGFAQTPLSDSIARSGWSWGCSAFDFDNDGFPDVYIANGHETKQTVRDYEPEFWLHDLYVDESVDDASASAYFLRKFARTRGRGWSYAGYEKNRLYLNQKGASFFEVAHLMGVALEADSRCVVTDDLDGDGRLDLLVTTLEVWPEPKQTLRIYRNQLNPAGNWIGLRFRAGRSSPVGVRVEVRYEGRSAIRQIVTGDSYRAQHPNTVHFGLGETERVDRVDIQWPAGDSLTLRYPPVNRYHQIP